MKQFLEQIAIWRAKAHQDASGFLILPKKHGKKRKSPIRYLKMKDGLERPLPNFCLKIPTGGKTLLAVKTIDLVQTFT